MTSTCDASTGIDLLRTSVDVSLYIKEVKTVTTSGLRTRKPLLLHCLRNQLKKDSRFLNLLCSKPTRAKSIESSNKKVLYKCQTPNLRCSSNQGSGFNTSIIKSVAICRTPKPTNVLTNPSSYIPGPIMTLTPQTIQLNQIYSTCATPIQINKKMFQSKPCRLKKNNSKISENRQSFDHKREKFKHLSPYVKKRKLSSQESYLNVFDIREIINITNGELVVS